MRVLRPRGRLPERFEAGQALQTAVVAVQRFLVDGDLVGRPLELLASGIDSVGLCVEFRTGGRPVLGHVVDRERAFLLQLVHDKRDVSGQVHLVDGLPEVVGALQVLLRTQTTKR